MLFQPGPAVSAPLSSHRCCQVLPGWSASQAEAIVTPRMRPRWLPGLASANGGPADHTSSVFEEVLASWIRRHWSGRAPRVGPWWGPSLHQLRAKRERFTEEVDVVGLNGNRVVVVGEAKWTESPMGADVLRDLRAYKIPALGQAGLRVSDPEIVLASRSGFSEGLSEMAAAEPTVHLLRGNDLLSELKP